MQSLNSFWTTYPALFVALLIASSIALATGNTMALLPLVVLLALAPQKLGTLLILTSLTYAYVGHHIQLPKQTSLTGIATLHITDIHQESYHQKQRWALGAWLRNFEADTGEHARNLPVKVHLPLSQTPPSAQRIYELPGRLIWQGGSLAFFKASKGAVWTDVDGIWSLAELRWACKQRLQEFLERQLAHSGAQELLTGLATGEFHKRSLLLDYQRCGLSHILAISGFHFSLLALLMGLLIRLIVPIRSAHWLLLLTLTTFFIFIGPKPSIVRAWMAAALTLGGLLCGRRAYALNNLGVSACVLLLTNPLLVYSLAFQFSYIATASILLYMPLFNRLLHSLLIPRPMRILIHMPLLDQLAYILITYLRGALALSLAVNLCTAPLILFHFQAFPMTGLIFNLFYPVALALALLSLVLMLLLHLALPTATHYFFGGLSYYTQFLVQVVEGFPTHLAWTLRCEPLNPSLIMGIFLILLIGGIFAHTSQRESREINLIF